MWKGLLVGRVEKEARRVDVVAACAACVVWCVSCAALADFLLSTIGKLTSHILKQLIK